VASSLLFAVLLLANIGVVGFLVLRYLSQSVITEALESSRQGASRLARALQDLPSDGQHFPSDIAGGVFHVRELYKVLDTYVDNELTGRQMVSYVVVTDQDGEIIYQNRSLRGKSIAFRPPGDGSLNGTPESILLPRGELVVERDGEQVYDIVVPVSDQAGNAAAAVHLLVPESRLEERVTRLRRSLITNVFIGAGLSLLVLVVGFLYVLRMLHRTRQLEAEAQMADRLAYVGTLAGGLAHEIRNPLNAMNMNVQMLQEELEDAPEDSERAREYIDLLEINRREIMRLERLVSDFLAYARPQQLRPESLDPAAVVKEITDFLEADFRRRGVALVRRVEPGLPRFNADPGQLRQALINVMINAADAVAEDKGTVEISASLHGDDGVAIAVSDNGGGIPPQEADRIFQIFHSTKKGGTGLGLAISQRIVEAHGGTISAGRSDVGGALFTIALPLAGPAAG
jgi:signal transduction histidine kinase